MAKAVEDKVAAVIKFVTDFQGMVPTWYILEGGFETFQGTRTLELSEEEPQFSEEEQLLEEEPPLDIWRCGTEALGMKQEASEMGPLARFKAYPPSQW